MSGREVSEAELFNLDFTNIGSAAICPDDFIEPCALQSVSGVNILKASLPRGAPGAEGKDVSYDTHKAILPKILLNPGSHFLVSLVLENAGLSRKPISIHSAIRNVEMSIVTRERASGVSFDWLALAVGVGAIILVMVLDFVSPVIRTGELSFSANVFFKLFWRGLMACSSFAYLYYIFADLRRAFKRRREFEEMMASEGSAY